MDRYCVVCAQAWLCLKPDDFTALVGEGPISRPTAVAWRLDPIVVPKLLYRAWHAYWLGGDPHGQPVILWHGFLSTGYAWREVAPVLADAGLAVLIPDMRGFGDSDKPDGTVGYDARALAEEGRA